MKLELTPVCSFGLPTRVSSNLIGNPINKALCHICSLTRPTS